MCNRMKIFAFVFVAIAVSCSAEMADGTVALDSLDTDMEDDRHYTPTDFFKQCTGDACGFLREPTEALRQGVPTWHAGDSGFTLKGVPAALVAVDEFAAHPDVPVQCYQIQILGKWDATAGISIEMTGTYGVFGVTESEFIHPESLPTDLPDGEHVLTVPLSDSDWGLQQFEIHTLAYRGKLEFSLKKEGEGEALFYLLQVDGRNRCSSEALEVDGVR
ncbi:MAG: hypothetical protein JXX29_22780 [Deltaproteobacteria bacterium]|nr:hypothetical protein [Deltaproteobacteria bacterium]MBN2674524.1 hypothetical protein [Deltaproteobacteria bacterium]